VRGRLDVELVRVAIDENVKHQEALRTQVAMVDDVPMQKIASCARCDLLVDDLTALPRRYAEAQVSSRIEEQIGEPVNVAVDPLLAIRLLKLDVSEHVLVISLEHLISDARSLNILLRDLFSCYAQLATGRQVSLPEISIPFADYAIWRRKTEASWLRKHYAYWQTFLSRAKSLRFPIDAACGLGTCAGWGNADFHIDGALRAELQKWSIRNCTTLAMTVFAIYVAVVLRWCGASDGVIRYQSDGRVNPLLQNVIGYFAAVLYIPVTLDADSTFVDLLRSLVEGYCIAYERSDFSYIAAQMPNVEVIRNPAFNWVPAEPHGDVDASTLPGSAQFALSPVNFTHPMLKTFESDCEPSVLMYDSANGIRGSVYFPLSRFSSGSMAEFVRQFMVMVRALPGRAHRRVADIDGK
jgi:hypothetical protein